MNRLTTLFVAAVQREYGITLTVEGTGGGCTALTGRLDDGSVIAVTDGNLGHDLGSLVDVDPYCALYLRGEWEDGGSDPVRTADHASTDPVTLQGLLDMVDDLLHG